MSTPSLLWSYAGDYSVANDGSGFGTFSIDIPPLTYDTTVSGLPTLLIRTMSGVYGSGTVTDAATVHGRGSVFCFQAGSDNAYTFSFTPTAGSTLVFPALRQMLEQQIAGIRYSAYASTGTLPTSSNALLLGGTLTMAVRLGWDGTLVAQTNESPAGTDASVSYAFPDSDTGAIIALIVQCGAEPGFDVEAESVNDQVLPPVVLPAPLSFSTTTYIQETIPGFDPHTFLPLPIPSLGAIWEFGVPESPAAVLTPAVGNPSIVLRQINATGGGATVGLLLLYTTTNAFAFTLRSSGFNILPLDSGGAEFFSFTLSHSVAFDDILWGTTNALLDAGVMVVPFAAAVAEPGATGPGSMKVPAGLAVISIRKRGRSYVLYMG